MDLSVSLAREARDAGAAAVILPPPFFFHYQPDDVLEYYRRFASHLGSSIDTFLSNTPESASPIPVETALDLLQSGLFAGIEDSSGSLDSFACFQAAAARCSFHLLVGSDPIFTRTRCARDSATHCAAVSAAACAVPELLVALDRAIAASNADRVAELDCALQEFLRWETSFPKPTIVKVATGLRGLKTGPASVPLSPGKERLLAEFSEWFKGWLPAVKKMSANA